VTVGLISCKLIGPFDRDSVARCGPKERRDSGQNDFFKARLDQIVDRDHALAKLGRAIDWRFLEGRFGAVYTDKVGHPPLPKRLMAGLAILKHMHDLSDEDLCARWVENPYYQLFCGEEFFQHKLTFDRSSLTRWRQRMTPSGGGALDQRGPRPALSQVAEYGLAELIQILKSYTRNDIVR
jgi:hypothetical protein